MSRIQEAIDDLLGTCKNLNDALPEGITEDDLTQEELMELDQQIFQCATCGWWCETHEMAEGSDEDCEDCLS